MFAEFGPAPVCLDLDLNTFEGPPHWIAKFRKSSGWLMVAEATVQSEHNLLSARLIAACDDNEIPTPAFQAMHLTQCHWHRVSECAEFVPDVLSDLMLEEEGELVRRWHREKNADLAEAFDDQEARIAELEGHTHALVATNQARIADLRRRRRHPALSPDLRSTMMAIIRELEHENDELVDELATTRSVLREQAAQAEEALWSRSDILVEVETLHVVRWKCGGVGRGDHLDYAPPLQPVTYYLGGDIKRAYRSLFPQSVDRYQVRSPAPAIVMGPVQPKLLPLQVAPSVTAPRSPHRAAPTVREPAGNIECARQPASSVNRNVKLPSPWTPERVSTLRAMWLAGNTASHIAKTLGGTSRNAVLGKAKRLGLIFTTPSPPAKQNTSVAPRSLKPAAKQLAAQKSFIKLDSEVRRLKGELVTLQFRGRKFFAGSKKYKRNEEERAVLNRKIARLQKQIAAMKGRKEA